METAKVFTNGGSQAVRLPKNCRFADSEVYVKRIGNVVMLIPQGDPWSAMLNGLDLFTDDFLNEEVEPLPAEESDALL